MNCRVINPKRRYVIVDGSTKLSPQVFHEELAKSALRETRKDCISPEIKELEASEVSSSFQDAMVMFS